MSLIVSTPGTGYCSASDVRLVSGISSTTDIGDSDLATIIQNATYEFVREVSIREEGIRPIMDSTRTKFRLPHALIADAAGDSMITSADITVRFLKREADTSITLAATGTVTIDSALYGTFHTANALPDGYEVSVDYRRYIYVVDLSHAKQAVAYLAAHYATLRLKGPGKVTRADLQNASAGDGLRGPALQSQRTKFYEEYQRILRGIRGPMVT